MSDVKDFQLPTEQGNQNSQGSFGETDGEIIVDAPSGTMTNKEMLVGVSIVIIGAIMFFFLSKMLTDSMVKGRKSPLSANRAGWSLFFLLTFTTALLVFGFLGHLWGNWLFIVPMGVLLFFSMIMLISSVTKNK